MSTTKPDQSHLTGHALRGFVGALNQNAEFTPAWVAHKLGQYFQIKGMTAPRDVSKGPGKSIRASDMRFTYTYVNGYPVFTRVE